MSGLWLLALIAVCLIAGTWIGFGFGRESMRIDTDLASFLLTVPIDRHDQ